MLMRFFECMPDTHDTRFDDSKVQHPVSGIEIAGAGVFSGSWREREAGGVGGGGVAGEKEGGRGRYFRV